MKNQSFTKLIFTFMVFGLTGMHASQAQMTMDEFLMKWDNSKQLTLDVVEKMPDNLLDYRPHESAMSFKEQVTHVGGSIAGLSHRGAAISYIRSNGIEPPAFNGL